MQPLHKIIGAIQREVAAALRESNAAEPGKKARSASLPAGVRLEAERIVLTLDLSIVENGDAITISAPPPRTTLDGATPQTGSTLRIEFKPSYDSGKSSGGLQIERQRYNSESKASGAAAHGTITHTGQASGTLPSPDQERILQTLSMIFGPPGFDSSARATVFREVLGDLSPAQTMAAMQNLINPGTDLEPAIRRARTTIVKIIRHGPLKSVEKGAELLAGIYSEFPGTTILKGIANEWKTQEDWLK
jgi:hypothetical protein